MGGQGEEATLGQGQHNDGLNATDRSDPRLGGGPAMARDDAIAFPGGHHDGEDVVEVGRLVTAGAGPRPGGVEVVEDEDVGAHASAGRLVENLDEEAGLAFGDGGAAGPRGVALGDVDGGNPSGGPGPDEGEREAGLSKAGRVNGVARVLGLGLGRVVDEPSAVEPGRVGFGGPEEVPVAVPDFHPCVVAAHVGPEGGAGDPGRDADGATGVREQDGEPGAGGHAGRHRLEGGLVGAPALGVVADLEQREEALIEPARGLAGRGAILHERPSDLAQARAPVLAGLVGARVGQDVIQEQFLGDASGPWGGGHGLVGQHGVGGDHPQVHRFQVDGGHVGHEEFQAAAVG